MDTVSETNYHECSAMEPTSSGMEGIVVEKNELVEQQHETDKQKQSEETTDKKEITNDKNHTDDDTMESNDCSDQIDEHESIVMMEESLLREYRGDDCDSNGRPYNDPTRYRFHQPVSDNDNDDDDDDIEDIEDVEAIEDTEYIEYIDDDDEDDEDDSKDDDTDKGSEGKSQTNDQDNQEQGTGVEANQIDIGDQSAPLGRNRRVRQKNRYFLDFHCTDLTKGGRSNKCDDEITNTTTTTAGKRRRSKRWKEPNNYSSIFGPDIDLDSFPHVYCRKCRAKTPHSEDDGGCQVCIYNKAVKSRTKLETQKGQKDKSKPIVSEKFDTKSYKSSRQNNNHNSSGRRKSNYKPRCRTIQTQNRATRNIDITNANVTSKNSDTFNISSEINSNSKKNNSNVDIDSDAPMKHSHEVICSDKIRIEKKAYDSVDAGQPVSYHTNKLNQELSTITTSADNTTSNDDSSGDINHSPIVEDIKLPKLDSWTPDDVADYISSKGFSQEAELFKTQSVDGISLLLMQRTDFTYGLKMKLGPALKIYDQVCRLKKDYFRIVSVATN